MDDEKLAQMLGKACPRPAYLASSDGGPALALALHCLMVNAGFVLAPPEGGQRSVDPEARFEPQKDWNGMLLDQWIFTYTKPGKARKFTLHCSLQARTKRMFIHSCEENNYSNVCVLGLQLDNYVAHPKALRSNNWAAGAEPSAAAAEPTGGEAEAGSGEPRPVVCNAAKMSELLTQYVLTPLLQAAEDEQGPPPPLPPAATAAAAGQQQQPGGGGWLAPLRSGGTWFWPSGPQGHHLAAAAAVGLAALGLAALVLARSRQPPLPRRDF